MDCLVLNEFRYSKETSRIFGLITSRFSYTLEITERKQNFVKIVVEINTVTNKFQRFRFHKRIIKNISKTKKINTNPNITVTKKQEQNKKRK